MARQPRLALAGHTHLVLQLGHAQSPMPLFVDADDRLAYLSAMRGAAVSEGVQVHAFALLAHEVQMLLTPQQAAGLGHLVQAIGRKYVSAYHRRHGGSGTLWNGRFRCCVLEPGATRLEALLWVDAQSQEPGATSAVHRQGGPADPVLTNPPEFWQLGNTPFERDAAYGQLLAQQVRAADMAHRLRQAAMGGWALGSPGFVNQVAASAGRPASPRPRGRPSKGGSP